MQLPNSKYFLLTVPEPHILLLTINRPKQLNSLNPEANREMDSLLDWAEENDDIWCIILTGAGNRAFCTGMDLVSMNSERSSSDAGEEGGMSPESLLPENGFGGLANRRLARKPIIAAVNGYALGGGTELTLACNIVVATKNSIFGLPEVKQGVVVAGGALARLARAVSYQVASEITLTGRQYSADEFKNYGLVNQVVDNDVNVVDAAMIWARKIVANSPDALFVTKYGILLALDQGSLVGATSKWLASEEAAAWRNGDNLSEGLAAFATKRKPVWTNPTRAGKSRL
ncbi:hypothetical protein LRAMOSA06008 [Lichtheimia ramosa]|uniref:Enoyl-CoA hydratase n=1 Tax=Lichtheimia ramosa TaxID=688394 RepID=A0A077X2Z1_9FUNG|nr:hypothetical protein LRAMOSA06008 [Lichtheimia ramosa]